MRKHHPSWQLLAPNMKLFYLGGVIFALKIWGVTGLVGIGDYEDCEGLFHGLLSSLSYKGLSGLWKLPWTVNISERQEPGSVIHIFSFNCSCPPTLEMTKVEPSTSFFNQPSLSGFSSQYFAKVTLSSSARLDARQVNHYQLNLKLKCVKKTWNFPLSVEVFRAPNYPVCLGRFASSAGDHVQVMETVAPNFPIYTVVLQRGLTGIKMSIINQQEDFPGFSMDDQGRVLTPSQGLMGSASKHFQLKIMVTNGQDKSCWGTLTVEVLANHSNKISFGTQFQTFNISEDLVAGGVVGQVQANGSGVQYDIIEPVPCPLYSINSVDGVLRTTTPLDLVRNPGAAVTKLRVKALDPFQPWISALLSITINVHPTNTWAPRCTPALLVTQVPETIPVGSILMTLACSDLDSGSNTFHYQLWHHNETMSRHSFRLQGPVLQVNNTLDYDSTAPNVQYRVAILVTDGGQPPKTSKVPVLVTVTPVNEYPPVCPAHTFLLREDSPPGKLVGTVLGSDRDYPPNSIEYRISDPSSSFYIDPRSGKIYLLASLDYEKQKTYLFVILLTDRDQDQDSTNRRSGSCTITIEIQNVNDHAPECEPPFQELTISSAPSSRAEVTKLTCSDRDVPEQTQGTFSFTIVGGNKNEKFYMKDNILFHNIPFFSPDGFLKPQTYELLVRVRDNGPTFPFFSTTAIVIIHVIPWTTTTTPISTKLLMLSSPTPLLVTSIENYWTPEPWFVVVLTVTGVLLLIVLGWILCRWPGRMSLSLQTPRQSSQALLLDSSGLMVDSRTLAQIVSSTAAQELGTGSEDHLNITDWSHFKKLVAVFFFGNG